MKYKKNDLQKIIAQGSLKQRLVLWFNHAHSRTDNLLTKEEERELLNSFRKNNGEALAFNEWEDKRIAFAQSFWYIDLFRRTYKFHMARLTGFTVLLNSYRQVEDILNDVLFVLGDDPKREEVVKHLQNKTLSLAKIKESKDKGFIDVNMQSGTLADMSQEEIDASIREGNTDIKEGTLLRDILALEKLHATKTLSEFKGALKAVKEILKTEGFKSQFHEDLIREYEEEAQEYQGVYYGYDPEYLADMPDANPRAREHLKKFYLFPEYKELKSAEDTYTFIMENYKKDSKR